jgi:hypothetical protein
VIASFSKSCDWVRRISVCGAGGGDYEESRDSRSGFERAMCGRETERATAALMEFSFLGCCRFISVKLLG